MRSLLIAPCDDEAAVESALGSEANAIILAVDRPAGRAAARATAARVLAKAAPLADAPALLVRVSALSSGETNADLEAVMAHMPFAVVLPNCVGAASLQRLAVKLAVYEAERGLKDGTTRIVALTDCAEA
ncbi:MAG: hypothetical protein JOY66_14310, partial [Acetobacteraceae bacterium]|nr:hypothetical protein [Acetobacteraceae bacterium]